VTISPAILTLLEKVAVDNGFDRELPRQRDWLGFASTQAPLSIWLTAVGDGLFLVALSRQNVARALEDHGTAFTHPLPEGACAARGVKDMASLHHLVRRAFQLSRTLPDELLHAFERETAKLPRATEAERLVIQRVGQDIFRAGLLDYWDGRCAITGLAILELLRASHIKPWAACTTDAERLDIFNGLLLAPNLDAAFDAGFITVDNLGALLVSDVLDTPDRRLLGLDAALRLGPLDARHVTYLSWHSERIFRTCTREGR